MNHTQTVSIYRHRKTSQLRIQPFARLRNGSSQAFGEQVQLPIDVSDDELLATILYNLAKNDSQVYRDELTPRIPKDEWHRQLKEDQLISLYRLQSGFRLVPSRRMGKSFGSIDEMIFVVPSEEFLRRGGEIIRQLFDEIP